MDAKDNTGAKPHYFTDTQVKRMLLQHSYEPPAICAECGVPVKVTHPQPGITTLECLECGTLGYYELPDYEGTDDWDITRND